MDEFFYLNREKKAKVKAQLVEDLQLRTEIIFAYLHGSFIDPVANFRDLDLAVWLRVEALSNNGFEYALNLALTLDQKLHLPVDVQLLNLAPVGFKFSVFKYGELLFCKDYQLLSDLIEQVAVEYMAFYQLAEAEFK